MPAGGSTRLAVVQGIRWQVAHRHALVEVSFTGHLDEHADFAELRPQLTGRVVFDLGEVRRINSAGVHRWVDLMRSLVQAPGSLSDLALVRCPTVFINQLNLIDGMAGPARVASFYVPFLCEPCGAERLELIEVRDLAPGEVTFGSVRCPRCAMAMELDEDPVRYFGFLARRR